MKKMEQNKLLKKNSETNQEKASDQANSKII